MFVTANQSYVFIACFAFGAVCGTLFTLFYPLKLAIKNKWCVAIIDFIIFIIIALSFVLFRMELKFPNLMPYMFMGVFSGILAYMKSFHITLAKCVEKVYNKMYIIYVKYKRKFIDGRKRYLRRRNGGGKSRD